MPYQWGYQPYPVYQPSPQQQGIAGVRFVNGIGEARSVAIPYGSKALFMDAGEDVFYVKETDMTGASTVDMYRFEKVEPRDGYVTRAEFEELKEAYESAIRQGAGQPAAQRQPDGAADAAHPVDDAGAGQGAGAAARPAAGDNAAGVGRDGLAGLGDL